MYQKISRFKSLTNWIEFCSSKEQMQLTLIKKKQCDAKALAIVEQLLEPNVNSEWLLQNVSAPVYIVLFEYLIIIILFINFNFS